MKKQVLLLALAATLGAAPAHAIYINDHAFVANGGDMNNVQGTYTNVFDKLRTASLAPQVAPVGKFGNCTATWLGVEGDYVWLLTSGACVPNSTTLAQPLDSTYVFRTDDGVPRVGYGGAGAMSFVHPKMFAIPAGVSVNGVNIAMVRLNLSNPDLAPSRGALLNDVHSETDVPVTFVSYGSIGVNNEAIQNAPTWRVRAESVVDGVEDVGHGLFYGYGAGSATHWARTTRLDGGGAWWQQHDGRWHLVATTSDTASRHSKGARVSMYASWINDLFPGARLASEGNASVFDDAEVTDTNQFVVDYGKSVTVYKSEGQPDVIVSGYVGNPNSTIIVPVTNVETGATGSVVVRTPFDRYGYNPHKVIVDINKEQTSLPAGVWKGRVNLDVVAPVAGKSTVIDKLELDIAVTGAPQEGLDFRSKNMASATQSVYFTVPTQTAASGPTTGFRNTKLGYSTLTVQGRNAITQQPATLKLRAQRVRGTCTPVEMNNAMPCGTNQSSILNIWFDPIDNPSLAAGTRYAAKFNVQARSFGSSSVNQTFPVNVDVNLLP